MKIPYGDWPKHPVYKDAGACNKLHYLNGVEGWSMWLLTKVSAAVDGARVCANGIQFGQPKPWSVEEVNAYVDRLKKDMNNPKYHLYNYCRRVWVRNSDPAHCLDRTNAAI